MDDNFSKMHSNILLYQTEDGQTRIDVQLHGETVWLSQKLLTELYQVTIPTVSEHLKNIFSSQELVEEAVVREFRTTAADGKEYLTKFYNLEAILHVGYRVRSHRGAQFRRWATESLRAYLVKGFVMDDQRLKETGTPFGTDYFDELLERIRDIRASEKRFYRKITDIYTTAVDYNPSTDSSQEFFATVQNKLHWAIHGHTAAELICDRADADKPNMGLMSWKGTKVRKKDIVVAKNYLSEGELRSLNRIVTMYLDYAEDQAERHNPMYMRDWADKLNGFLEFNGRETLANSGKIQKKVADSLAREEFEKFNSCRLKLEAAQNDDFENVVKEFERK